MPTDNVTANPGAGGATFRALADGTSVEWSASVLCYATTVSAGANVLQVVTPSFPLPITGTVNQGTANATPWNDNIAQVGGAAIALGQALAAASIPVVLTAAQITTLTPLSTVTANQGGAPWSQNITQIAGAAISQGHGTAATAIRVELPTDGTGVIAGVTTVTTVTTVSAVTAVTTITNPVTVVGDAANGAAAAGNPVQTGGVATNVEPTAVSTGNAVAAAFTLTGKEIVYPYANPENTIQVGTSATDGAAHNLFASQGAGVRSYITTLSFSNSSATAITVAVSDGTLTMTFMVPAGGGTNVHFPMPLRFAAATAVTFTASTGVTTLYANASGFKGV